MRHRGWVNLGVCGRFHFHNYAPYLAEWEVLNRFYYSHRIGPQLFPTRPGVGVNLWGKEYLMRASARLFGEAPTQRLLPSLHDWWEAGVLRSWTPAPLWHLLLHGTARRILRRGKAEGSVLLGEAVNAHPRALAALLQEEEDRLGFASGDKVRSGNERLLEELESVDHLLIASRWLKRSFLQNGFPEERIHLLPYGVNLARFTPGSRERPVRAPFRVLCVAHISPRKGHIDLLEAWRLLGLPDAELLLIGTMSEPMRRALRRYEGQYKHIPFIANGELPCYYRSASVFVLPSIEDGFGVVCLEAMACGLPVIVTENTGAADMIVPKSTGFVVPIRSPERIGEALESLYRDRTLLARMGEEAAREAKRAFGWENYARLLGEAYGRLMGGATQG
ncbi:glycosyltransferase family 4 protein [Methylacidimicrobium sp. B4]|uniref:glycosyltransferase family 4 protein n=1 Tax=Methylacidimicrobium sp. B4 TaxID=2796139 RepID=UPI001A8C9BE1|nr:glycosyltransferase family 4 protein [Methylacidimicrobium sp. B4]QSR85455.1 glycosyltransferase family 4 protein [Methylacidimicrobium sp. B4]